MFSFLFYFDIPFYSKLNYTIISIPTQGYWIVNVELQPNAHVYMKTADNRSKMGMVHFLLEKHFFPLLALDWSQLLPTDRHTNYPHLCAQMWIMDLFWVSVFFLLLMNFGVRHSGLPSLCKIPSNCQFQQMKPLFKPLTDLLLLISRKDLYIEREAAPCISTFEMIILNLHF